MTPPSADFAHLRLHSEYDVYKGVARLSGEDGIAAAAAAMQQPALALSDTGCLFGAVKFYDSCRAKGVKPLIGCELKVSEKNETYLLLLCASREGYINLSRLLSRAAEQGGWANEQWLDAETTAGIIALSGARRGDIGAFAMRGREETALQRAREWAARFPGRFYLEVWRADGVDDSTVASGAVNGVADGMLGRDRSSNDDAIATVTAELGKLADLPLVATHPVQCSHPEDVEVLKARLCIASGKQMTDPTCPRPLSPEPYLLPTARMREKFADFPGAVENSLEIAKRCNFSFDFSQTHLPSLAKSGGKTAADILRRAAADGLEQKNPSPPPHYLERLRYELDIIADMGFADYFLIVMDFIRWAKRRDIPVGPGRGSGAGSLVAYALDITTLDPIEYGLLFERFLNPERVSMPDFDIDFCIDGRDDVIQYVSEKYGSERVSQIVTFGTIGARGAVRDVGRVLGMPYGYCDSIARMVSSTPGVRLKEALKESPDLAEEQKEEGGGRLLRLAMKVEGLPRNIGTHAGGVLIAPSPLEEYCPRTVAADTQTAVSQFDMKDIEKIGLVKFDFLGLRTLTILAHAENYLRAAGLVAPDFSLENIPLDDASVYELYACADTTGVFQCESDGMRELMQRLRPDRFDNIVALMALYRPGPLNSGIAESYIQRKNGNEAVTYPHEAVRPALAETYGLCVYQEQVMEIARQVAGYSLGEADLLRRAMGKKKEDEMAAQRARFIDGSEGKLSRPAAGNLFDDIEKFSGYGFNKSHAAAYAMLSYRTAYVKKHYPAAFFAAVLSAECGDSDRVRLLVTSARARNINILSPDVNKSRHDFYAVGDTIHYGLEAIKGLGRAAVNEIITTRGSRPFADVFDFSARLADSVQLGAAAAEMLAAAGAFDSLHENRAAVLATLPTAATGGGGLFAMSNELAAVPPWTPQEKLLRERTALGFCLTGSFYQLHEKILALLPLSHRRLSDVEPQQRVCIAGLYMGSVTPRWMRARGFGLLVLEDNSGRMEVRTDEAVMKALPKINSDEDVLIIEGGAQNGGQRRQLSVSANHVLPLDDYISQRLRRLIIACTTAAAVETVSKTLLPAEEGGGGCEIIVRCRDKAITCDCSLGGGWPVSLLTLRRLLELKGVEVLKLEI